MTGKITAELNLDARAVPYDSVTPNVTRSTYGTSITTYDTQGNPKPVSLYFQRIATAVTATSPTIDPNAVATTNPTDQWAVYTDPLAANQATPVGVLCFDSNGVLSAESTFPPVGPPSGLPVTPTDPVIPTYYVDVNVSKVTQYGVDFAVSNLTQDGYTSGAFTGLSIDNKGVITTRYSNGQTLKSGGMIALADFRNVQGLSPVGGGEYLESYKSGTAVMGQPTVGSFGELRSGAVEESNVDLTAELVNMMTAQRNYQANAQTIKTQDQIMSTLVNLR